jgi:hypothetical protein
MDESKTSKEEPDPFETIFVILIAFSATLSGLSGYLSASSSDQAGSASTLSVKELNIANTMSLEINMNVSNEYQIVLQGDMASFRNDAAMAQYLYTSTDFCTEYGYIDGSGNVINPKYGGDLWAAFDDYRHNLLAPYREHMNASQDASTEASHFAGHSHSYLLTTVLLAITAGFATIGISAKEKKVKFVMLAAVIIIITVSVTLMGLNVFS